MNSANVCAPQPNEPIRSYCPGSDHRADLKRRLDELKAEPVDIPAFINGKEVRTGNTVEIHPPHELARTLGVFHTSGGVELTQAIDSALAARHDWTRTPWQQRAAIFLKAADLLAGPWRDTINAATMLAQSKNAYQAEIDAACELVDFLRFNVHFAEQIYAGQPISPPGVRNTMVYRPLEGFVFAVAPFNFTSIAGNLATAPAIMGNTVVWKPASTATLSAYFIYKLLAEAGLPDGVINLVVGAGAPLGEVALNSPHLAGLHFTGSVGTFRHMWRTIGANIADYRSYPRIVGETGGKDFIVAHVSADRAALNTAIIRGAFEYQGQKCSAASRVYVPDTLWPDLKDRLLADLARVKMGPVEDFTNFINAVIDRKAYDRIASYIDHADESPDADVIAGGGRCVDEGYFIEPTVIVAAKPDYRSMCEEIFGPVVTIYVYPADRFAETLELVDRTSPFALTGAIFAQDRAAVTHARDVLAEAAGNFYINDKPTGAVVGQQPFGGARASGTNDKAGSYLNLIRWTSPLSIKETFAPAQDFTYEYMAEEQ